MKDQSSINKVAFIGGGNMATAIISGLKQHGQSLAQTIVIEPSEDKQSALKTNYGVKVSSDINEVADQAIILLAIKPQQLQSVCASLKPLMRDQLIISIAAGIRTDAIAEWLGDHQKIIRVMPNTPAQVQAGISALFALDAVSESEKQAAEQLMQAVGESIWLDEEAQMDAVTAISGSGPAYVFYCIEALQLAATKLGLSAEKANQLALQTFLGASQLAAQSDDAVATLREKVTSKGGTTEKGVAVLEESDVKSIFYKTAKAAADQSVILGDRLSKD